MLKSFTKRFHLPLRFASLFSVLIVLIAVVHAQTDCAEGDGVLDPAVPKNMSTQDLIQKLVSEENKVQAARSRYTFTQDVLVQIAESVGLPGAEARQVLAERTFKAAVDADWQKSHEYGVTGVPTFVAAGRGVVGAQPYEVLEQLVEEATRP